MLALHSQIELPVLAYAVGSPARDRRGALVFRLAEGVGRRSVVVVDKGSRYLLPDEREKSVLGALLGFGEEVDLAGEPCLSLHAAHRADCLVRRGDRFGVVLAEKVKK